MAHRTFHTPALYPDEANAWLKLGVDPRHFFRQDGTMDKEAFFAVLTLAEALTPASVREPVPTPAPPVCTAPVCVTITVNRA